MAEPVQGDYPGVLIVLGFTRLTPLFLGTLIVSTALGGRYGSIDAFDETSAPSFPRTAPVIAGVFGILGLTGALLFGVEPGGYSDAVAGAVGSMVFLYATLFAVVGSLADRSSAELGVSTTPADD